MKSLAKHKPGVLAFMLVGALCLLPLGTASAGPLDFTAAVYEQNGVDPAKVLLLDSPGFGQEINVITGGFNNGGNIIFYTANNGLFGNSFTENAAGQLTRDIADSFIAWIFPLRDGDPFSPAPPNRRQDNIFDTRDGYFSNNPLGLWKIEFIQWRTDQEIIEAGFAHRVDDCAAMRANLLVKNGPSLDGNESPALRTSFEVRDAKAKGCVSALNRPAVAKGTEVVGNCGGPIGPDGIRRNSNCFRWVT